MSPKPLLAPYRYCAYILGEFIVIGVLSPIDMAEIIAAQLALKKS